MILLSAIHEKGFLLYLSSSHASFLLILVVYGLLWSELGERQRSSFRRKAASFVFSTSCLALMAYFYYRHIVHCDKLGKLEIIQYCLLTLISL